MKERPDGLVLGRADRTGVGGNGVDFAAQPGQQVATPVMPEVRAVAADLARQGRIAVLQRGVAVDAVSARGPIRLDQPAFRWNHLNAEKLI